MNTLLPVIDSMEGVEDKSICGSCIGFCCTVAAGIAIPRDFGPVETLTDVLVSYFKSGFWCVDYWEGDPRPEGDLPCVYYVRPQHTNARGRLVDPSWGGTCALWAPDRGCSLEFRHRPHGCRVLIPDPERKRCVDPPGIDKEWYVRQWIQFQGHIVDALRILGATP